MRLYYTWTTTKKKTCSHKRLDPVSTGKEYSPVCSLLSKWICLLKVLTLTDQILSRTSLTLGRTLNRASTRGNQSLPCLRFSFCCRTCSFRSASVQLFCPCVSNISPALDQLSSKRHFPTFLFFLFSVFFLMPLLSTATIFQAALLHFACIPKICTNIFLYLTSKPGSFLQLYQFRRTSLHSDCITCGWFLCFQPPC